MKGVTIIDTTIDNISRFGVCGYKSLKKEGFPEKFEWLKTQFQEGLIIKTLYSEQDGAQGMIEYIPGENCWRPVEASGCMFIHCLFVGFKRIYKNKGYATLLLEECEKDARMQKRQGIAVVTRKGSFMAGKEIFLKNGYEVVDSAEPDFDLLFKRFNPNTAKPYFNITVEDALKKYADGLTILRAGQCPYTVKNVREIAETALSDYGIKVEIVDLKNHREAQRSPCAFGTFCIIYDGKIIAEHPISRGRFVNIMKQLRS